MYYLENSSDSQIEPFDRNDSIKDCHFEPANESSSESDDSLNNECELDSARDAPMEATIWHEVTGDPQKLFQYIQDSVVLCETVGEVTPIAC